MPSTRPRSVHWLLQAALGIVLVTTINFWLDSPPAAKQGTPPTAQTCATNNGGCAKGMACFDGPAQTFCGYCPAGYNTSGTRCEDVNECAVNNGSCGEGGQCTNVPGGWRCGENCPPGFTGTPATGCRDINECQIDNGSCDQLAECRNTLGGRTCGGCPADHAGDGYVGCFDNNELTTAKDGRGPAVAAPSGITVIATSAAGAVVRFTATATDFVDGERPVTCTPASGGTFPIGNTNVTCTAVDGTGNYGQAMFKVTVVAR